MVVSFWSLDVYDAGFKLDMCGLWLMLLGSLLLDYNARSRF